MNDQETYNIIYIYEMLRSFADKCAKQWNKANEAYKQFPTETNKTILNERSNVLHDLNNLLIMNIKPHIKALGIKP
jgi:hypothetical protein